MKPSWRAKGASLRLFRAARKLLYWWASALVGLVVLSRSRLNMLPSLIPSFGACLCHGGVAGANRIDRRLWRSSRFAPTPSGTDTARPTRP